MELADDAEKTRCIKLYGLLPSMMRGRALPLVKAAEDSNGFDAWSSLNQALKPTSKARGLALLGAATANQDQIGPVKLQLLPEDNSIQMEDKSEVLHEQEKTSLCRSIVGSGIYLCQERFA